MGLLRVIPLAFLMASNITKPERPSLIYEITSIIEHLDLERLFPVKGSLEVELGSGDGSFLVAYAARYPTRNFIGVERLLGRIRKLERKARRAKLTNLRAVRIEAAYFLQYLPPPHSVQALHIYFPDPWPKRKHRRHRLINESFPAVAQKALAPGGQVYLRTDDENYFEQMVAAFNASPLFAPITTPAELAEVQTDFEKTFEKQNVKTLRAGY